MKPNLPPTAGHAETNEKMTPEKAKFQKSGSHTPPEDLRKTVREEHTNGSTPRSSQ